MCVGDYGGSKCTQVKKVYIIKLNKNDATSRWLALTHSLAKMKYLMVVLSLVESSLDLGHSFVSSTLDSTYASGGHFCD